MKVITAKEAAALVPDGGVIISAIDGMTGWPEEVALALEERFLTEGHPKNITSIRAAGLGNWDTRGESVWCHEGMLAKSISSYVAASPALNKMVVNNQIMAWIYPLGTIMQVIRDAGRRMPGILTKTGLGTFMDPRFDGGKLNDLTKEKGEDLIVHVPDFMGEEYLFYKAWKSDIGLLRGTTADRHGNISCEREPMAVEMTAVAQAVKASGGKVILQVDRIVEVGEIHPRMVSLPGIYVDYLVVAQDYDNTMQNMIRSYKDGYNPAFTGEERVDMSKTYQTLPLDGIKVITRRAAMELSYGDIANFGIGMPTMIGDILEEEGCHDVITMISETGVIGGVPARGMDFGCHWNVEAFADHVDQLSFYEGGNLDAGFFGISEVDEKGDMNTSHLNGRILGVGGFSNMSMTATKAIFMGTFTAVGLETKVEDGRLQIVKEGKYKKFVKKCAKISFVADNAVKNGNKVVFITERCVFLRDERGMVLVEIAPGVDLQKDILDQMDFMPLIPEEGVKTMDLGLFQSVWGGLKEYLSQ